MYVMKWAKGHGPFQCSAFTGCVQSGPAGRRAQRQARQAAAQHSVDKAGKRLLRAAAACGHVRARGAVAVRAFCLRTLPAYLALAKSHFKQKVPPAQVQPAPIALFSIANFKGKGSFLCTVQRCGAAGCARQRCLAWPARPGLCCPGARQAVPAVLPCAVSQAALAGAQACGARTGTCCALGGLADPGAPALRDTVLARVRNAGWKARCTPPSNATVTDSASLATTTPLPCRRARTGSPGAKATGEVAKATLAPGAVPAPEAKTADGAGLEGAGCTVLPGAQVPRHME